jgi:hypothetical protein
MVAEKWLGGALEPPAAPNPTQKAPTDLEKKKFQKPKKNSTDEDENRWSYVVWGADSESVLSFFMRSLNKNLPLGTKGLS